MKIGIELARISNGGGERILSMLVKEFSQLGHKVVIFTWNKEWVNYTDFNSSIELFVLKHEPRWGYGLLSIYEMNKAVKESEVDCIISFLGPATRIFVGAAMLNNIPVITSLRIEPNFKSIITKVIKCILWCCDGIVFQTQAVRNSFKGRIYRNSVVIPNPIIDDNLPYSNPLACNKEIIGIGRLTEQKNFAMLIDAFAELNPEGYILKIYGEGHLKVCLQKQIERLNLKDRILLMGHVERVVDHIASADIFVLSSDWEGMPNALLESMAIGLACIATDVATGGCRELITHGENGLLIPVCDKESLKKNLRFLIENESIKHNIKSKALNIRKTHAKDEIILQWISFIESKCIQFRRN